MRSREFGDLAGDVAAVCGRFGVPAWSEEDRERLEAALWRFIHPDLAHSPADPYRDVEADYAMKVTTEPGALAAAVKFAARALTARAAYPILGGLKITADDRGVEVAASGHETSARARIAAEVGEPGTVLAPGRLLAEITGLLPRQPAELAADDGTGLTLAAAAPGTPCACCPPMTTPPCPSCPPRPGRPTRASSPPPSGRSRSPRPGTTRCPPCAPCRPPSPAMP